MAQICIRTDQEDLDSFRDFCLVNGLSHGQGLALLMRNYRETATLGTATSNKKLEGQIKALEREVIQMRNQARNAYRDQIYSMWTMREENRNDVETSNYIAEQAKEEEQKAYDDAKAETMLELSRKGSKPKDEPDGS